METRQAFKEYEGTAELCANAQTLRLLFGSDMEPKAKKLFKDTYEQGFHDGYVAATKEKGGDQ